MFQFLFGGRKPTEKLETQRERFERLILELNDVIDALPEKPAVTVHTESGRISFTMPTQFMDEALALPKPDPVAAPADPPPAQDDAAPAEDTAATSPSEETGTAPNSAKARKRAGAPVPRPPKPKAPSPRAPK